MARTRAKSFSLSRGERVADGGGRVRDFFGGGVQAQVPRPPALTECAKEKLKISSISADKGNESGKRPGQRGKKDYLELYSK